MGRSDPSGAFTVTAGGESRGVVEFALRGEFIPLDALLKATGLASSGGTAKQKIVSGMVSVDGLAEIRRSCKIRAGQVVACEGAAIRVIAAAPQGDV